MPTPVVRAMAAQDYVRAIRARTTCRDCGKKPIEWHHPDHINRPRDRVGVMVQRGLSLERIKAEIEASVPLCRGCHMREDGRLSRLNYPGRDYCAPYRPFYVAPSREVQP